MKDKVNIIDLCIPEIEDLLYKIGEQKFRAKQIFEWIHKGVEDFGEMTNLSKTLRYTLSNVAVLHKAKEYNKLISKVDGTTKYLLELHDGNIIECVLMKYKHGNSVCITTQVGCKMGCKFCASTGIGFIRDLTAGELIEQILFVTKDIGERVSNIVLMGVGEPLDNFENVIKFLKLINDESGLNIGLRHVSISTCGLVPGILKLKDENLQVTLSISLHATNDETRDKIMPINKRYPIKKLLETCKIYSEATKRRISFEYAMIDGVNDTTACANELSNLVRGMICHVNLIAMNDVAGTGLKKSNKNHIEQFKSTLENRGIETTIRRELGTDISAACGQLRRSVIEKN